MRRQFNSLLRQADVGVPTFPLTETFGEGISWASFWADYKLGGFSIADVTAQGGFVGVKDSSAGGANGGQLAIAAFPSRGVDEIELRCTGRCSAAGVSHILRLRIIDSATDSGYGAYVEMDGANLTIYTRKLDAGAATTLDSTTVAWAGTVADWYTLVLRIKQTDIQALVYSGKNVNGTTITGNTATDTAFQSFDTVVLNGNAAVGESVYYDDIVIGLRNSMPTWPPVGATPE